MILPRPLPIRVHEVREHAPGVDIGIWLVDCHHELIVAPRGPEVALEDGHGLAHGGKSHLLLPKWLIVPKWLIPVDSNHCFSTPFGGDFLGKCHRWA